MHADLSPLKLCIWAPPLTEVLHCSALNAINMQRNNGWFLPETATRLVVWSKTEEGSSHQESNLRSLVWAAQNKDPWFKFLVAASLKWVALGLRSSGCPLLHFPSHTIKHAFCGNFSGASLSCRTNLVYRARPILLLAGSWGWGNFRRARELV